MSNTDSDTHISFSLEKPMNQEEVDPQSLNFEDKYYLLCGEVQKLKRRISNLCDALRQSTEDKLFYQSERDIYREQCQELTQEARGK